MKKSDGVGEVSGGGTAVSGDQSKPQNKAEREYYKSLGNGKRGRITKEAHDERVEKLLAFRKKNASV